MRIERGVVAEQRRAVGADDLPVAAHVEIDVRVIEWRQYRKEFFRLAKYFEATK